MIRKLFVYLFLIGCTWSYAQEHESNERHTKKYQATERRSYIPLPYYKEKYKTPLTAKDSASFIIRGSDTLVYMETYQPAKGVKVDYEYKDSTFLHHYKKIAFTSWVDSLQPQAKMRYWKDDLRIFLSKSISGKPKRKLKRFARGIDQMVDSLNISFVRKVEESNYIIYTEGDFEYESQLAKKSSGDFYLFWNGKSQIYKCAVKLDKEGLFNNELFTYKLKELFFQTLGYFKLSDELACESYFSNCYSSDKKISRLDKELLKYHYSYGICKGTTLIEFEKQHQIMKKRLKEYPNAKLYFLHSN